MKNRQTKILGRALLLAGVVLCGAGLWLVMSPAQYAATARIKVMEMVAQEAEEYFQAYPEKRPKFVYDYYSYGPTIYKLRSQTILTNVIDRLKLGIKWQKIHHQMRITPVRNTKLIAITFFSNDSKEAADVANAIAGAYRDWHIQFVNEMAKKGIEILSEQYLEEEIKIQAFETNLNLLREKHGIVPSKEVLLGQTVVMLSKETSPTEQAAAKEEYERAKPFWDAKRDLILMVEEHRLLGAKIEAEKLDSQNPRQGLVQIVDQATPPQKPVGPSRLLGLGLFLIGLVSLLTGAVLLKSARRKPA